MLKLIVVIFIKYSMFKAKKREKKVRHKASRENEREWDRKQELCITNIIRLKNGYEIK